MDSKNIQALSTSATSGEKAGTGREEGAETQRERKTEIQGEGHRDAERGTGTQRGEKRSREARGRHQRER